MTSENLEEKTQEQKRIMMTGMDTLLMNFGFNYKRARRYFRKKGYYESKNYGEVQKYGKPYGS